MRELANQSGFAYVAFSPIGDVPRYDFFLKWLAADRAGEMTYLHRDAAQRRDPRLILEQARTVVCVALSYQNLRPVPTAGGVRGLIARYAWGEDYHLVLRQRLQLLAERIRQRLGRPIAYRACVDTAPLLEREIAAMAGLGFAGKNTLLIIPGVGSYTVLGELLLDLEVPPGEPMAPRCGQCNLCLTACPTGAIVAGHQLDARRCISYLTIELHGPIPVELRPLCGTWIFGCDLCQEVCPFNAVPRPADPALRTVALPGTGQISRERHPETPELAPLLRIGAAQFRKLTRRRALRRITRAQLLRNVAVALGNAGGAREVPDLIAALFEPFPLIRRHVAWALGQIAGREPAAAGQAGAALLSALSREQDDEVRAEISAALVHCPGQPEKVD